MNQASHIITKCGGGDFKRGVPIVAELAGVHITRVFRWTYPKGKGGSDGIIPAAKQQKILENARARGIDLTPDDFFLAALDEAPQ